MKRKIDKLIFKSIFKSSKNGVINADEIFEILKEYTNEICLLAVSLDKLNEKIYLTLESLDRNESREDLFLSYVHDFNFKDIQFLMNDTVNLFSLTNGWENFIIIPKDFLITPGTTINKDNFTDRMYLQFFDKRIYFYDFENLEIVIKTNVKILSDLKANGFDISSYNLSDDSRLLYEAL